MEGVANEYQYDFFELAQRYPNLKPFLITETKTKNSGGSETKHHFEFSSMGQYQLLRVILLDQFGLVLKDDDLVEGRLIPTAPSRMMYLKIVDQVLDESGVLDLKEHKVRGIDVGCGTYAIYCILGHALYNWEMVGVDIDDGSLKSARAIVKQNNLSSQIEIFKNDGFIGLEGEFSFVCCNPPFYESFEELEKNTGMKPILRRQGVVGAKEELVYENNGEIGFISKLIEDSLHNDRSIWYSSLISKKRSVQEILDKLKRLNCGNFLLRSLNVGISKKWTVFWSWKPRRPMVSPGGHDFKNIPSTIAEFKINLSVIEKELMNNELLKVTTHECHIAVVSRYGDVWSRSFRRRKIDIKALKEDKYEFTVTPNSVVWKYGSDPKVFQSFYTLVKKCMSNI